VNSKSNLTKKFGAQVAGQIQKKLTQLEAFENLQDVPTTPPFSRHNLDREYKGCVAIDAVGRRNSIRIVLEPIDSEGNRVPLNCLKEATGVCVVFVGDYH